MKPDVVKSKPAIPSDLSGPLRSERGAALILVIILSTIALVIMTTVLYMVTRGTSLSGSEKRYKTACEAGVAGISVVGAMIKTHGTVGLSGVTMNVKSSYVSKMTMTGEGFVQPMNINPNDPSTYDMTIDMGSSPVYRVFAKMTQRRLGNTSTGHARVRTKTGVVPARPAQGQIRHEYFTFSLVVQPAADNALAAQQVTNNSERCRIDLVNVF